jgi:cobalt-zinc-cadmium efflux system protein
MKKQEDTTSCDHIDQQHKHHHSHTKNLRGKKLLWVTLLNFSISLVQVAGGIISNSLSLNQTECGGSTAG